MQSDLLLRECEFPSSYRGYNELAECVRVVSKNENRLLAITEVYDEVGEKFQITGNCVEKNIRTLINVSWNTGCKERLESMTGAIFYEKLSTGDLIDVLVCHLVDGHR